MAICPGCGEENPDRFRLCGFCGTPLQAELPAQEVRKTVTIVFSDLKDSTSLGERLDSESLREVISRYFEEMRAALERHGGRVEKYIGDAIMAVFGLPRSHEDDALRAVRAAYEMKLALAELNHELERRWGVTLQNRTGVNTGEVVAGDSVDAQRLVTGDAVNVAARLEQVAPALEVLLSQSTYRLVRHAVEVEPVEPLELKGKSERVHACRLVSVSSGVDASPDFHATPLVGRERELALLEGTFAAAVAEGHARLATVVGQAGLGKSRLVGELLDRVRDDAVTIRGRALAYGDGITFWPLLEAIREAAEIADHDRVEAAREKLALLAPAREDVVARVASAIGLSEQSFSIQELFWAIRELFQLLARDRPLVVLFEDLHWADPTFLDLVEHLADGVAGPLLLLCDGRPELLEARPAWHERAAALIELAPLNATESERMIENMLGETGLDAAARAHVVRAAEGNPLFVEQLLSMLIDDGVIELVDGRWHVRGDLGRLAIPPTIQTLLAARLDLLTREQRAVLDPAAVIGQLFPTAAVRALVPDGLAASLDGHLDALEGKQLVRAAGAHGGYDDAYRFQHGLIRDTAYEALLKRARANLHERFVDWAEPFNEERGRRAEFEEILGYHLEQAHRYLGELGPLDEHARELGARGAAKLASAGRRAFQRGDMRAAATLLRRAVALRSADDPERVRLLPTLAEALMEGADFTAAEALIDEVLAVVPQDDVRLRSEAMLTRLLVQHHVATDLGAWRAEVLAQAGAAIPELERLGAHAELAKAWRMMQYVYGPVCRWGEQVEVAQKALEHARLAGDRRLESRLVSSYAMGLCEGPTPVVEAIEEIAAILDGGLPDRQAEAMVRCLFAYLLAMNRDFDQAREQYLRGGSLFNDVGGGVLSNFATIAAARVELLAAQPAEAALKLQTAYDELGTIGERYYRPLVGALLAQALLLVGAIDQASTVVTEIEELADPDDTETQVLLRTARARVCASADALDLAVELAREAVELTAAADAPAMRAGALATLGEVLAAAELASDAEAALGEARALYERKGNRAAAAAVCLPAASPDRLS